MDDTRIKDLDNACARWQRLYNELNVKHDHLVAIIKTLSTGGTLTKAQYDTMELIYAGTYSA